MFRTKPGEEGKGSGAPGTGSVRPPSLSRASRTASDLSESSVRVLCPSPLSESAFRVLCPRPLSEASVRVLCPSPLSESSVRVLFPSPLSESAFRVLCPSPLGRGISAGLGTGPGLFQTVSRLRARPDILAWYTHSKKLSIQGNKLYTVSDVIEKCKTQSSPAMNGRRV